MSVRPCVYVSSCVAMRVVVRVRENRCLLCIHMSECVYTRDREGGEREREREREIKMCVNKTK
jgi:hypothetical protein